MKTFRAMFPSEYRSVSSARRAVADFASNCGFEFETVADIALAVGEACNNAAEHGHVAHGFFTVTCEFDDHALGVAIQDIGRGFEPSGKGEFIEPAMRGARGLGMFLMRVLMDAVSFSSAPGGTKVMLSKRLLPQQVALHDVSIDGESKGARRAASSGRGKRRYKDSATGAKRSTNSFGGSATRSA